MEDTIVVSGISMYGEGDGEDLVMAVDENADCCSADKNSKSPSSETKSEAAAPTKVLETEEDEKAKISPETKTGPLEGDVKSTVALIEGGGENDVIVLDEDDSGVSNSKKARKEEADDEIMEVDENGVVAKVEKESVAKVIRTMKRQDLEDLVLAKIVEGIVAHTEVGQLRSKVLELQMQKDKMASKMGIMLKQVAELSNAVNMITENEKRDPKNRVTKPHAIRFNRSVGLQTSIEPSVRNGPPKFIHVPEPVQNGVKTGAGPGGKSVNNVGNPNGSFAIPQSQGVKRSYGGSKAVGEHNKPVANQISTVGSTTPSPRKVYSSVVPKTPPKLLPIVPKPPIGGPTASAQQPGIVDLTDDDPPSAPVSSTTYINLSASPTTTTTAIINGVPVQIVKQNAVSSSPTAGVQIVQPGQKYVVAQQSRPMILQQLAPRQQLAGNQNQQFLIRGMGNNNSAVTILPTTRMTRPAVPLNSNGNLPRVAATVPARGHGGALLGASGNIQKRFVLPSLPPVPTTHKTNASHLRLPPKPELTLNEQADGIVLSWNLPTISNMAEVVTYQIFACQESLTISNKPPQWKRVGDVKALPLPMACTLSQFTEENRYYFIVRGIDTFGRVGPFCDPQNILLRSK